MITVMIITAVIIMIFWCLYSIQNHVFPKIGKTSQVVGRHRASSRQNSDTKDGTGASTDDDND